MKNKRRCFKALSLAEMSIVLLVLCVIIAAATPIITHKAEKDIDDTIPAGSIIVWGGTTSTIPHGWHLCDGSTVGGFVLPDLRSRFIYGSGYDNDSKSSYTTGWNSSVAQHFKPGVVGGEEIHTLVEDVTGTGLTMTQEKVFLPRFISLAYIIKLPCRNSLTTTVAGLP